MNADLIFQAGNLGALFAWAVLILLPRWQGTQWIAGLAGPALLAAAYVILLSCSVATEPGGGGGFGSIAEVRALLSTDIAFTAGWFHYLAFDLFVGAWEVREAQRRGLTHWAVIPCLLLTFMAGPAGLLLFLILRAMRMGKVAAPA
ncbi:hypothetical protein B5C34_14945 [Pacificimonas flava]|uniref:Integral membrane protein n=2 Tax=Pacificimonas TaxID=1960290 RepID=A0A219B0E9_9SPHN|nr:MULTISPECIES: ABA4-like family protein [Pacificimonas]MBZ6379740.1 DUF4281 domain-containing protein [Pacificimonas aurantium]OWV31805.1 hypothetical protein B5C34_14945 [Pacificimonas flava]